jgi:transcriptional regulator with XRE-family HTH domain
MSLAKDDQIHALLSRTTKMVRDFLLEQVLHGLTDVQLAKELGVSVHYVHGMTGDKELIAPDAAILCRALGLDLGFAIRDVHTGKEVTFYAADNFGSKKDYETQTEEVQHYDDVDVEVDDLVEGLDGIPVIHQVVDGSYTVEDEPTWTQRLGLDPDAATLDEWSMAPTGAVIKYAESLSESERENLIKEFESRHETSHLAQAINFDVERELGEDTIEAEFSEITQRDLEEFENKCENCLEEDRLADSRLCFHCDALGIEASPLEDPERPEDYEIEPLHLIAQVDARAQRTKEHSERLLEQAGMLRNHNED